MNLHRVVNKNDWQETPKNEQNYFQRLASKTGGIVTPANLISIGGLGITLSGIKNVSEGQYKTGGAKIIAGRLCDIVDGFVADKTGTKSTVGEAVDAVSDKIGAGVALYALRKSGALPSRVALLYGVQNGINIIATAVAKKQQVALHPTAEGKITTLLQWASISSFVVEASLKNTNQNQTTHDRMHAVNNVLAASAVMLGTYVNYDYMQTATSNTPDSQA